jgi:nitroreductase
MVYSPPSVLAMLNDRSGLLAFLKSRKSASAKAMGEPGPSRAQIDEILSMAVRVPDHGKLAPWRFIVFESAAREDVGQAFGARWRQLHPDHGSESVAFQMALFTRAPVVIAVVSTAAEHVKIPIWEQQMSAGAVCLNLELAAMALGFDVQWQTDWVAYDDRATAAMGVKEGEKIAGLIFIGTTTAPLEDRPRPDAVSLTSYWTK